MEKCQKTIGNSAKLDVENRSIWVITKFYDIKQETAMTLHLELQPLLAIAAGILIFAIPKMLNYIVAIYLILFGLLGIIR